MGSSFNRAIFDDNVQNGLFHWVRVAKHNKNREITGGRGESNMKESTDENKKLDDGTQLERVVVKEDAALEG